MIAEEYYIARVAAAEQESERLRAALRYYAETSRWAIWGKDKGKIAREALKKSV